MIARCPQRHGVVDTSDAALGHAHDAVGQRSCLVDVLSDPPYNLDATDRTTPSRVSLVIEF